MSDSTLRDAVNHLLCKVNKVTAYHRHSQKIPISALDDLANYQVEFEEIIDSLTKPTRYNWPEILAKYPWARWAATDRMGYVTYHQNVPAPGYYWWCSYGNSITAGRVKPCPDWRDSLEPCPPELLPQG